MKLTGQIIASTMFTLLAVVANATPVPLAIDDCLKCHDEIVTDISMQGGKHSTEISCLDCHTEHPPKGANAIPACSQCHDPQEKSHYSVADCLNCHNPHHPLKIATATGTLVKTVCITCHVNEGAQLTGYPSQHSELDCNECHLEHGQFLTCLECHESHNEVMDYADCLTCHKPHMPTLVKYPESIPSSHCTACHETEAKLLATTQTLHNELSCAFCHKTQHKVIPKCTICHGVPHTAALHNKFPSCLKCHIDAHDLHK